MALSHCLAATSGPTCRYLHATCKDPHRPLLMAPMGEWPKRYEHKVADVKVERRGKSRYRSGSR